MSRLANKIAMVVGAGQSPGETLGNGRATALLFAAEGVDITPQLVAAIKAKAPAAATPPKP